MIAIKNLNGVIEADNLGDFIEKAKIQEVSTEMTTDLRFLGVAKIVNFYEFVELQLKPITLEKLPQKYKEKIDREKEKSILEILRGIPV